ncbi:MAG: SDR family NAD(P)-dependent oxidoreductase [Nevskia sp.]|nr:SDR family NAD(P)-dependent oxidoreductase [Nevskia sp.]
MDRWQVQDQVIVIAGASKGIGLACAQTLLQRGARVALLARDRGRLDEAVAGFKSERACGIAADVCDKAALEQAFAAVKAKWGRIDGLVNNVGFQFARRLEVMPEPEVRKLLELNFLGPVFACQCVIPHLRAAGGGRIVNVSSASVRNDNEFSHLGLYSSAKAALEHFSRELRHELKADRIMVTVFSPGAVATGSVANFDPAALGEAMQDWLTKGPRFDGAAQPETIGAAIAGCFEFPPGVAVEFMEVRPNIPTPKMLESDWKQEQAGS